MRQIFLVFIAYYGINCFSNVYFLFGPLYEQFGASPRQAGLFLSIFYMAMILCRPLGSWVMEHIGIRRALIGSSIVSALTGVGMALSVSNAAVLLFFRALSGVSVSVFIVATVAYQSMVLDAKSRGKGFALFATGSMIPMATVVPLAEWFLRQGWTALYLWLPTFVALLCLAVSMMLKDGSPTGKKKEEAWASYSELFRRRGVAALYVTGFLMSVADGCTICVASLAAERDVAASGFMVAVAVAAILIRTVGFKVMDMAPRILLAAPAAALMGFSLLAISFTSSAAPLIIFGCAFGLGIGMGYPTDLSLVGDLLPVEFHPKATGGLLLAIDCGWFLSPLIFGFLSPLLGAAGTFRLLGLFVGVAATAMQLMVWMPMSRRRASL